MRLALGLEYDGTDWNGWQTQPDHQTIQDQLESAITQFTTQHHPTICAGRTDAGVHARGQVVHIDTPVDRPDWSWVRGLNALLPSSIAVQWACVVPDDFHARFSARSRAYTYRIYNAPVRSPLYERRATWFYRPLNLAAMVTASRCLIGQHDFSAFRSSACQASSPVRQLTDLQIEQQGAMIIFRFRANAFLHHMVRNLVGSIVEVGRGAAPVEWLSEVLSEGDRTAAARTFPPQGLCFDRVEYDFNLPCEPELKSAD